MFDVIGVVDAGGCGQVHGGLGPGADEGHHEWVILGAIGGDDFQVDVVFQACRPGVRGGGGGAGGIGPAKGGSDGRNTIPDEHVRERGVCSVKLVLGDALFSRVLVVVTDDVGGSFRVHQAPAIAVIGARVSDVIGGVNQQTFERAGAHRLAGEEVAILLDEQGG